MISALRSFVIGSASAGFVSGAFFLVFQIELTEAELEGTEGDGGGHEGERPADPNVVGAEVFTVNRDHPEEQGEKEVEAALPANECGPNEEDEEEDRDLDSLEGADACGA
jgi:hypothetical protein